MSLATSTVDSPSGFQHLYESGPNRSRLLGPHEAKFHEIHIAHLSSVERALRAVALGRKNFLFAGSNAGADRVAAIHSLLGSAKLNCLDPEIYLHHVLGRIAELPINRIIDLSPWNLSLPRKYDHS
jgi:IS66 C-terminal element/Transposase IS66 family